MFERFTDPARRVVVLAQEEARRLGHDWIGTEHVLLGLLREQGTVAAEVLTAMGVRLDRVRGEVEGIIGRRSGTSPSGHIPFTPRAKKVLELSLREALHLGHNHIGTEHVLLGLLREGEGLANQVLVKLGADLPRVRQAVLDVVAGTLPAGALSSRSEVAPDLQSLAAEPADFTAVLDIIQRAYAATTSDTDRADALEDGDGLVARWAQARLQASPWTAAGEVRPWWIRFSAPDEAEVGLLLVGPDAPLPLRSWVERVDGRWRVCRESFCQLLAAAGVPCD
ncbi:MAG: hypothetical protein H0U89_01615 [Acidimicrobiia bacterium]|nr:hypothetical protein [Acidimicrobiia bacterium]